jgi:hypothetical protein
MAGGVIFVDELDGEDRVVGIQRACFLETNGDGMSAKDHRTSSSTKNLWNTPRISTLSKSLGDYPERQVNGQWRQLRMVHCATGRTAGS